MIDNSTVTVFGLALLIFAAWIIFDSMFGWPWYKKLHSVFTIYPLIHNYKLMKWRARACHFLTDKEYMECFGEEKDI